jgi:hypothetical protein
MHGTQATGGSPGGHASKQDGCDGRAGRGVHSRLQETEKETEREQAIGKERERDRDICEAREREGYRERQESKKESELGAPV